MPIVDENLQLLDEARERLLKKHGGFDGLCDYLLRQDRLLRRKLKVRARKSNPKSRRGKIRARA